MTKSFLKWRFLLLLSHSEPLQPDLLSTFTVAVVVWYVINALIRRIGQIPLLGGGRVPRCGRKVLQNISRHKYDLMRVCVLVPREFWANMNWNKL